jgi:hypothetical protein
MTTTLDNTACGEPAPTHTLVERLYNDAPTASLSVEAGAEIQRLRAALDHAEAALYAGVADRAHQGCEASPRVSEQADERALFEAWFAEDWRRRFPRISEEGVLKQLARNEYGGYVQSWTAQDWTTWQARAALTHQAAPAAPNEQQEDDEESAEDSWRRLALQFDGHRMQALHHLRAMLQDAAKHAPVVTEFLNAPPLSGAEVLAQRIAAYVAPPPRGTGSQHDASASVLMDDLRRWASVGEGYACELIRKAAREIERLATAKSHVILQAQIWHMEAVTQRDGVIGILRRLGLPERDWEAKRLIVSHIAKLTGAPVPRVGGITLPNWGKNRASQAATTTPIDPDFIADLERSRAKYPNNASMLDGLCGELHELKRAYQGDGDVRAEAFDVAVCAYRLAVEGDSGGNRKLGLIPDAFAWGAATTARANGEALTDTQYQEILRPVLSRHGMQRYLNANDITLDPSDYRAIIDRAITFYRVPAPSREAAPQIKPWRERLPDGIRFCPSVTEAQPAMEAEISDLRAALAVSHPPAPTPSREAAPLADEEILQMFANAVGNENDGARYVEVGADEALGFARALLNRVALQPIATLVKAGEVGDLIEWHGPKPPDGTKLYAQPPAGKEG